MQLSPASCDFPLFDPHERKTADKRQIKTKFTNEMNRIHDAEKPKVGQFNARNSDFFFTEHSAHRSTP
jgi:hypothetical protein